MEYFYLLTRSSFFIFRVLLCSPSFSYSRPFIINSPDNRYYYSQIWKWTFPRTAYEHGYNTYLSSSLYYLYFLRFINIITEFDSSFSPATISFSLPFSSPFSFARQGLKHLKHDRLQFLHLQIFRVAVPMQPGVY